MSEFNRLKIRKLRERLREVKKRTNVLPIEQLELEARRYDTQIMAIKKKYEDKNMTAEDQRSLLQLIHKSSDTYYEIAKRKHDSVNYLEERLKALKEEHDIQAQIHQLERENRDG